MRKIINEIIQISRSVNNEIWSPSDRIAKLFEEGGELSEAVQIKNGKLKHKERKEDNDFEECADVIQCALDALCSVNLDMSETEIVDKLIYFIKMKNIKWKNAIDKF